MVSSLEDEYILKDRKQPIQCSLLTDFLLLDLVYFSVLRGEKARFQLFGDTINTASRIESTGVANRIQISQETAELIMDAGKTSWLTQRQDKVHAKGKGMFLFMFR